MRQSVLYYPHIEIPDPNWLKSALLLWDDVYRIVPESYSPRDSPEMRSVVDAGLLRSVQLEKEDLTAVTGGFKQFLMSLPFLPDGLDVDDTGFLHPDKVDAKLYPLLEKYATDGGKGGWIELPREIVRGYMFYLSLEVARRRNLERATHDHHAFAVSGYFSEQANFEEMFYDRQSPGYYSSLIFESLLPARISDIPMQKVLSVANHTRAERTRFRQELMRFSSELCTCESAEHAMDLLGDHRRDLILAMNELRSSQGFLGANERGSLVTMGIPVALTAYGAFISAGGDPFGLHALSGSLLIGAIAAYSDFKKARSPSENPYGASYLVSLDKQFAGTGTFPAFDRFLNEFIND